jgi:hypothetical protein
MKHDGWLEFDERGEKKEEEVKSLVDAQQNTNTNDDFI